MNRSRRVPRGYEGAADRAPRGVVGGQVVADVAAQDVVVFLIGMRVNRLRRIRSWWPVFAGMPRMLAELRDADLGLLDARTYWSGRTFLVVQYWRTLEQLGAYARSTELSHARAWAEFNRRAARDGDVGIFHETYLVPAGQAENVYGNMPPFGLAKAHGPLDRADASLGRAHGAMSTTAPEYVEAVR